MQLFDTILTLNALSNEIILKQIQIAFVNDSSGVFEEVAKSRDVEVVG